MSPYNIQIGNSDLYECGLSFLEVFTSTQCELAVCATGDSGPILFEGHVINYILADKRFEFSLWTLGKDTSFYANLHISGFKLNSFAAISPWHLVHCTYQKCVTKSHRTQCKKLVHALYNFMEICHFLVHDSKR